MFHHNGSLRRHKRIPKLRVPHTLLLPDLSAREQTLLTPTHCLTLLYLKVLTVTQPAPYLAFKPPYTMRSSQYFRIQLSSMIQVAFIFRITHSPPRDHRLPSLLQQLDLRVHEGHRVNDYSLFLARFWGLSSIPTGLGSPAFVAFCTRSNVK